MKGCLSETRRGGHEGKRREMPGGERETGFLFPRMEARELYSLLSIFETSLASPRRNPLALAPSYAASLTPPSPPPPLTIFPSYVSRLLDVASSQAL